MFSCSKQKPINTGFSSQLARSNHEIKKLNANDETKNGKAAPKSKAKATPKSKQSKKKKKKTHQHQQTPEALTKDKQATKKAMKKKGKGKKKQKKGSKVLPKVEGSKEEEQPEEEQSKETTVPEGFDPNASRSLNRKRFTSRAWHQGFDGGKATGLDDEGSKARAREASQNASKQFDLLWPNTKKLKGIDVD